MSPSSPALMARLHANKTELLKVLKRPEIPLHTNGSENDKQRRTCGASFFGVFVYIGMIDVYQNGWLRTVEKSLSGLG
jgi:hypothetical protein